MKEKVEKGRYEMNEEEKNYVDKNGENTETHDSEYTFVSERIVDRRERAKKVAMKLLVDVLLPVCVCLIVCYIYLSHSGKLDSVDNNENEETTTQNGIIIDNGNRNDDITDDGTSGNTEEADLEKMAELLNKMVVVVSVVRDDADVVKMTQAEIDESGTETETETANAENNTETFGQEGTKRVTKYTGAIISMNGPIYILIPRSNIEGGTEIYVHFVEGTTVAATVYDVDCDTGLALLKVETTKVNYDVRKKLQAVTFDGNADILKGSEVIYCGQIVGSSPMYLKGNVANNDNRVICTDLNYNVLITDIMMKDVCDGFVFNSRGNLVGIAGMDYGELVIPGVIAAAEALDLKYIINNMLNDKKDIYFGIEGQQVTSEIEEIVGGSMPKGIYVSNVIVDSPAYNAGIMTGDIIVSIGHINEPTMESFRGYIEGKTKGDTIQVKVRRRIGSDYNEYTMQMILSSRD